MNKISFTFATLVTIAIFSTAFAGIANLVPVSGNDPIKMISFGLRLIGMASS